MQLMFKQSVCLFGKDYPKGLREVDQEVLEKMQHSKFAQGLIDDGLIVEPDFAKDIKQKSIKEEMLALAERVKNGPVDLAKKSEPSEAEASEDEEQLATKASNKKKKGK